ncbi:MAG: RCC1 domain-containing protein, partial [Eubacteriales bacterium]
ALGAGGPTDWGVHAVPVQVPGMTNIIAIASGYEYCVALKSDGTVWTWGDNGYGQLGDGTRTARYSPVQVADPSDGTLYLTGVKTIAAGQNHTIALKNDETVWTWGDNSYGQLGIGAPVSPWYKLTPVQVQGPGGTGFLTNITAIAGDYDHTLAAKSDGTVWAWGYNGYGQLGNGTTTDSPTPAQVAGPGGIGTLTGVTN